ncbi:MAG: leucine-rich repeat protein [Clostridia bacterium]|nr:leucine-rich repeat protein [Clostridia bacterium]
MSFGITSIGNYCFEGCASIENIELGDKVTYIGLKAFDGTIWFDNWTGTEESQALVVGDGILIKSLDGSIPEGTKAIASYTFGSDKTEITEKEFYDSTLPVTITIPSTVKTIGDSAFYYATNLKEINIEDGIKEIGEKAFYGCTSLTSVKLPSTLEKVSNYMFYGCAALEEIELPDSVKEIGDYAFYNCLSLETINYPASLSAIGEFALTNTKVMDNYNNYDDYTTDGYTVIADGILVKANVKEAKITIPANVKVIASGAFDQNEFIEEVTIPSTVKTVEAYAFNGCDNLTKVTSSAAAVDANAYHLCENLK